VVGLYIYIFIYLYIYIFIYLYIYIFIYLYIYLIFFLGKYLKYLTYELGTELSIREVQLIYKIKSLLGIGVVSFRKIDKIEMVTFRIKDHLKKS
jgi:hypothetical protein